MRDIVISTDVRVPKFQWVAAVAMKNKHTLKGIVADQTVGRSDIQDPLS
jgi:hypothetical protein